jgi:hypothetical protein
MEVAMRIVSLLSGAVLVLLVSSGAAAQQVDVQAVRVAGGTTYHGAVTESPDSITIELAAGGTLTLPRAHVRDIRTVRGQLRNGEFWAQDLNETRLFFGPTARTLPRGAAYVSVYMFVLPFAGYGVSDAVTLAGGVLPFFGEDMPLIGYVAPKVQILATESVQAAVGALAFFSRDPVRRHVLREVVRCVRQPGCRLRLRRFRDGQHARADGRIRDADQPPHQARE